MSKEPLMKLRLQLFAQTKAVDLINPEVMADAISAELPNAIRFAPYARVDNTLVGQAGDTITRPKYGYVGAAEDLVEGVPMDTTKMSMTTSQVTIKETGKAIEVTEKAVLVNVAGTIGEAEKQIRMAIADKMDMDYIASLRKAVLSATGTAFDAASILAGIDVFNDEDEQKYVLFINNKDYTKLVRSLFAVGGATQERAIAKGDVAEVVGVSDIVRTRRLNAGEAYLQKPGAVEIVYKRGVEVDKDNDILARTIVLAGNAYYTTNLYDESGVVKLTITEAGV